MDYRDRKGRVIASLHGAVRANIARKDIGNLVQHGDAVHFPPSGRKSSTMIWVYGHGRRCRPHNTFLEQQWGMVEIMAEPFKMPTKARKSNHHCR